MTCSFFWKILTFQRDRLLFSMNIIRSELNGVRCEYKLLEKLGEGGYSKVFKCERFLNGKREIFVFVRIVS